MRRAETNRGRRGIGVPASRCVNGIQRVRVHSTKAAAEDGMQPIRDSEALGDHRAPQQAASGACHKLQAWQSDYSAASLLVPVDGRSQKCGRRTA